MREQAHKFAKINGSAFGTEFALTNPLLAFLGEISRVFPSWEKKKFRPDTNLVSASVVATRSKGKV